MNENLFDLNADPVVEREWQDVCRANIPRNPQCVIDWIRAYMNNNLAYYMKKVLEAQNIFKENGITGYEDALKNLFLNGVQQST